MSAGEIILGAYLLSVPLVAYLTGRLTGDGFGMAAIAWPLMLVAVVFMLPFVALDWITAKANDQYRGHR